MILDRTRLDRTWLDWVGGHGRRGDSYCRGRFWNDVDRTIVYWLPGYHEWLLGRVIRSTKLSDKFSMQKFFVGRSTLIWECICRVKKRRTADDALISLTEMTRVWNCSRRVPVTRTVCPISATGVNSSGVVDMYLDIILEGDLGGRLKWRQSATPVPSSTGNLLVRSKV